MSNEFTAEELEAKNNAELIDLARTRGIAVPSDARKDELVQAIQTGEFQRIERDTRTERRQGRDAGEAEVQQRIDQENAQGFRGTVPDTTPNENYTVAGVTHPDKHVPEESREDGPAGRANIDKLRRR